MDQAEFEAFQRYCWQHPMKVRFSLSYCGEGWASNVPAARRAILECFPGAVFHPWRMDECDPCTIVQDAWAKSEAFPEGSVLASIWVNVGEVA